MLLMRNLISLSLVLLVSQTGLAFSKKQATPQKAETPAAAAPIGSAETVWIAKPDGGQMCAPGSGKPVEAGLEELKKAGVQVVESKKSTDGKMRAQACGMPTGATNAYQIRSEDLAKAMALGFQSVKQ
jgi:hypothetical protein